MAVSTNTISVLSIEIVVLFFVGYMILFFTIFKRKYDNKWVNLLKEDKRRFESIKAYSRLRIEEVRSWWTTRAVPGMRDSLKVSWKKETGLGYFLEILIIIGWGIFVGRAYLNMNTTIWPTGREFPSVIQPNYIWTNFLKCGACVFWNGFSHGGAPAFADLQGSMLYPPAIILTLLVGTLNGAKLTIIAGLIMGGCAQWWLTKVMGFGRLPRLYTGLIAIVGGQLAGRMELGTYGLLLSTAACSLILAPGVALGLTGQRRYSILLGVTIGLALLSGQGYMQVGLVLGILPAFLVFLVRRETRLKNLWKEYLLAGAIAALIAGIFLIPMIHFYPNVSKPTDPLFSIAQPLKFVPLNQLIDDPSFYETTALKPTPYPYLYINFLGWVPILLAIIAWRSIPRSKFKLMAFFLVSIILVYLLASADILKVLERIFPMFAGVRNPPPIAGLANPLILGLSAWGLDAILQIKLPKVSLTISERSRSISAEKIALFILAIPLVWSVWEAYVFGQNWLSTVKSDSQLIPSLSLVKTVNSEWINIPFGEHKWMIPSFDMNLKVADGIRAWSWTNRPDPPIYQEITSSPVDPGTPNSINPSSGPSILTHFENEYAFIQSGDQKIACKALATGGNIDVQCPDSAKGQLIVYENNWTGWYAWANHTRATLLNSNWLSTETLPGVLTYHFRYRPWDVWAGILLTVMGIALSIVLWFRTGPRTLPFSEIPL
jgi:hypothetical protein